MSGHPAVQHALRNHYFENASELGDAHLADHLGHRRAALDLAQSKGDLLFRVARLLHGTDPPYGSNWPKKLSSQMDQFDGSGPVRSRL